MPVGAAAFNPTSGVMVISADALNYRYKPSAVTLVTTSSKTSFYYAPFGIYYGDLTPWAYDVTVPSGRVPVVGAALVSGRYVSVSTAQLNSTTWRIYVYCVSITTDWNTMVVYTPTLYVWIPYSNADDVAGAGMKLYNSAYELSFHTNFRPLWPNQRLPVSFYQIFNDTGTPDDTPQSRSWTPLTVPVIVGSANGSAIGTKGSSGEDIFLGEFGWTYSGSSLRRGWFPYRQEPRIWESDDHFEATGYAASPLIIDGSVL